MTLTVLAMLAALSAPGTWLGRAATLLREFQAQPSSVTAEPGDRCPTNSVGLERSTAPSWVDAVRDGVELQVPYSPDWRVAGIGISPIDVEPDTSEWLLRFGRPVNEGTFLTREYLLTREEPMSRTIMMIRYSAGCSGDRPATLVTLGDVPGVLHFVGGASGCSLAFAFTAEGHSYDLYHVPDLGAEAPEVNEEMKIIAASVHESASAKARAQRSGRATSR
ncbi:MAG: hypothetical protein ACHREM_09475 [Polyangiales bacterium]